MKVTWGKIYDMIWYDMIKKKMMLNEVALNTNN